MRKKFNLIDIIETFTIGVFVGIGLAYIVSLIIPRKQAMKMLHSRNYAKAD